MDESVHGDDDHSVDDLRLGVDLHSVVRPIEIVSFLLGSCIDVLGDLESSEVQCLGNADSSEHEDDFTGCGIDGDRSVLGDNDHSVDDLGLFRDLCSVVGPDVRVSILLGSCIDIRRDCEGSELHSPGDADASESECDVSSGRLDGDCRVHSDNDHSVDDLGLFGNRCSHVGPDVRVSVHLCLCIDILGNGKGSEFDRPGDGVGSVDEGDVSSGDGFFGVLCDEDHSVDDLGLSRDLDTVVLPHVCESGLRCGLCDVIRYRECSELHGPDLNLVSEYEDDVACFGLGCIGSVGCPEVDSVGSIDVLFLDHIDGVPGVVLVHGLIVGTDVGELPLLSVRRSGEQEIVSDLELKEVA